MKNEKGFTLVELIAVIILLGVIALITVPIINSIIKDNKEKAYQAQVNTLIGAAKKWVAEYNDERETYVVKVSELIEKGYIEDSKVVDPRDETKELNGCIYITYTESNKNYKYIYKNTCD